MFVGFFFPCFKEISEKVEIPFYYIRTQADTVMDTVLRSISGQFESEIVQIICVSLKSGVLIWTKDCSLVSC